MKTKRNTGSGWLAVALAVLLSGSAALAQTPMGSEFTYQGQLKLAGEALNDTADIEFSLWDADSGGDVIGSVIAANNVAVVDGLFTVELDFGVLAFNGEARWLEIDVRSPAGGGAFTTLDPRQPLTAAPYALQTRGIFVDELSNVGIGETAPSAALDVVGTTELNGDVTINSNLTVDTNTLFVHGGSNKVGIGTTEPERTLHVVGNGLLIERAGLDPAVFVKNTFDGEVTAFFAVRADGHNDGYAYVTDQHRLPTLRLRDGKVGIGTNTPSAALDVAGTIAADTLDIAGTVAADALDIAGTLAATAFQGDGSGLTGLSGQTVDTRMISLLRWDLAYRNYSVGNTPRAAAFDGSNIWVANSGSNTVTKLRASDATTLGTFAVGRGPRAVAFDGSNIWVVNFDSDNVTKLRASDGTILGTFSVGNQPRGVAFDGANIWVSNSAFNSVTKLRASDGAHVGTYGVGINPQGLAFDGTNIWVADSGSGVVTKLRASDGVHMGWYAVGAGPQAIAFDGTNIWVTCSDADRVYKLRASDGANVTNFNVGGGPHAIAYDGTFIWVTGRNNHTLVRFEAWNAAHAGTFNTGLYPSGVVYDGANIWVVNQASNNVTRMANVK